MCSIFKELVVPRDDVLDLVSVHGGELLLTVVVNHSNVLDILEIIVATRPMQWSIIRVLVMARPHEVSLSLSDEETCTGFLRRLLCHEPNFNVGSAEAHRRVHCGLAMLRAADPSHSRPSKAVVVTIIVSIICIKGFQLLHDFLLLCWLLFSLLGVELLRFFRVVSFLILLLG